MIAHLRRFAGAYVCAALFFWLSDQPRLPLPIPVAWIDKVYHAVGYAVFAMLTWAGLRGSPGPFFRAHALPITWVLASAYGLTDEWHQSFVPGRAADPKDMAADSAGALMFCLAAGIGARRRAVFEGASDSAPAAPIQDPSPGD